MCVSHDLLMCHMTTDLSRMYKLYSRVEGGLLLLMKSVSAFLRERGKEEEEEEEERRRRRRRMD